MRQVLHVPVKGDVVRKPLEYLEMPLCIIATGNWVLTKWKERKK